jgi:dihydrodiol dehydrogenase / D-xylose 1-dehydrogenase (NADP)
MQMKLLLSSSNPLARVGARYLSTTDKPVRWGILSAGKIASDYAKAIAHTQGAEAIAVAARSATKAQEFADKHNIQKAYGSYQELLADKDVDVVYVGSIADYHFPLAAQSILAKKPTVVEKPLSLSYKDTKSLVQLSRQKNVFLMEGMWTRCFPATRKVQQLVCTGEIGKVVAVQADFGWSTANSGPEDRIWNPKSGGMILDIGMYLAQVGQVAYPGEEAERIQSMGIKKNGVDHTVMSNIQYSNGGMLQFYVTGDANTEERVVIQGTKGRIIIDPAAHVPTVVRLQKDEGRGAVQESVFEYPLPDDSYTSWNYPGSIGFTYQIQAVGEALRKGEKECRYFTLDDSLQVGSILDAVLQQVHDDDLPSTDAASVLSA